MNSVAKFHFGSENGHRICPKASIVKFKGFLQWSHWANSAYFVQWESLWKCFVCWSIQMKLYHRVYEKCSSN